MIEKKEGPVYIRIAENLKQAISQTGYAPGDLLPKEVELAKQFEISRATLRNALAILENDGWIIRKKRFGTIVAPYALHRKYRKIDIGFFIRCSLTDYQDYVNIFRDQLLIGHTLRRAVKRGYFVRFFPWDALGTGEMPYDLEEILLRKKVDAFVVANPGYLTDVIDQLCKLRIPHCTLETHINRAGVNSVVLDNEKSVAVIMKKLYKMGHRKIGYLGGLLKKPEINSHARRVLTEILKQANCLGMTIKDNWIQCTGADEWRNRYVPLEEMTRKMLSGEDRPTAVIAVNYGAAVRCIDAATEMGLKVPEDISVISEESGWHELEGRDISGTNYDLDMCADMVLDELLSYLRDPAYRPGKHCFNGVFNEGQTLRALN